jgi:hypothetical protein
MRIKLNPQRRDDTLTVIKSGDTLTINGEVFDLSVIPEGATLPADAISSEFFSGPVERTDGVLHITLTLPHGANPQQHVAFPEDIVNPSDGEIVLPKNIEEEGLND